MGLNERHQGLTLVHVHVCTCIYSIHVYMYIAYEANIRVHVHVCTLYSILYSIYTLGMDSWKSIFGRPLFVLSYIHVGDWSVLAYTLLRAHCTVCIDLCNCIPQCIFLEGHQWPKYLTLGAHAQWGLLQLGCLCLHVCLSLCVCLLVNISRLEHLFVFENAVTYSTGNKGQKICGDFSETPLLQRSNTSRIVRLSIFCNAEKRACACHAFLWEALPHEAIYAVGAKGLHLVLKIESYL